MWEKLACSICAQKVLLKLVNLKTKHTGDGYPKKAIELSQPITTTGRNKRTPSNEPLLLDEFAPSEGSALVLQAGWAAFAASAFTEMIYEQKSVEA